MLDKERLEHLRSAALLNGVRGAHGTISMISTMDLLKLIDVAQAAISYWDTVTSFVYSAEYPIERKQASDEFDFALENLKQDAYVIPPWRKDA